MTPRESLSWQDHARCLGEDVNLFFPERGGSARVAKSICAQCPVRNPCLRYALANREPYGIWGSTNQRERRKLKKKAS